MRDSKQILAALLALCSFAALQLLYATFSPRPNVIISTDASGFSDANPVSEAAAHLISSVTSKAPSSDHRIRAALPDIAAMPGSTLPPPPVLCPCTLLLINKTGTAIHIPPVPGTDMTSEITLNNDDSYPVSYSGPMRRIGLYFAAIHGDTTPIAESIVPIARKALDSRPVINFPIRLEDPKYMIVLVDNESSRSIAGYTINGVAYKLKPPARPGEQFDLGLHRAYEPSALILVSSDGKSEWRFAGLHPEPHMGAWLISVSLGN